MGTKICATCENELTLDNFRAYPGGGYSSLCNNCRHLHQRTPDNPYILRSAKPGEPSKHCKPCGRDIPLAGFSKNTAMKDGLATRCQDCQYLQNATGTPYRVEQTGEPLKRAYYEEKVIDGRRVIVREVR